MDFVKKHRSHISGWKRYIRAKSTQIIIEELIKKEREMFLSENKENENADSANQPAIDPALDPVIT